MWLVLLCTLTTTSIALAAVLTAFTSGRRSFVIGMSAATLVFAISTACVGVAGYAWGMRQVEDALAAVALEDPRVVEQLRSEGQREASWNWICGLGGAALPIVLGSAALLRGVTMREGSAGRAGGAEPGQRG